MKNTSEESPGRNRKVVRPNRSPVSAKIAHVGKGERGPSPGIIFGAEH